MASLELLEAQVVERLAPGRSVSAAEQFIPALLDKQAARLSKHRMVEGAKLLSTEHRCKYCKNTDQGTFEEDTAHGQVTCTRCGTVVEDRKIHDGEWKRQFEGDENPSQHGPVPDSRFSSGHNLRTNINAGSGQGAGANVSKKDLQDLKNIQEKVEMNLSNMKFGIDVRTTRIGYKDKQKREVFTMIEELAGSMQLHDKVVAEAQGLFADYREAMEQIQQRDLVAAACVVQALRTTVKAGQAMYQDAAPASPGAAGSTSAGELGKKRKFGAEFGAGAGDPAAKRASGAPTFETLHPFACKKCARQFGTKKDMRFHLRTCPNKDRPDLLPEAMGGAAVAAAVQASIATGGAAPVPGQVGVNFRPPAPLGALVKPEIKAELA
jgi:hypothetical protein